MTSATEQSRIRLNNNSFEERREEHSALILRQRYKWRILLSTAVINVILAGFLPSLGVLLYFELQDKKISLGDAIRTPLYFIISWCLADSWSQTVYTTSHFKKFGVVASIVTAVSTAVIFLSHDTLESVKSNFLLGFATGGGVRLLMTISENSFSEYFSRKSTWAIGFSSLITHSLGFIFVPLLVSYVADTEGIHYAILTLSVLALQILPAVILLRKPRQVHSSKRIYLTNQPAYALLHQNENDDSDEQPEEAETSLSQPQTRVISTVQHTNKGIYCGNGLKQRSTIPGSNTETADGLAVPLFTDVELVAGTYQGEVAYSFEDTMRSESPRNDYSELFFRGLSRRRANAQSHKPRCCGICMTPSLNQELHPLKHAALYLGLISMTAQEVIKIMTLILLPTLASEFPHTISHDLDEDVTSKVGAAFVSVITGIASTPVILVPSIFSFISYFGLKFTHGICMAIAAAFIYGIGIKLPELHISVLITFGLSNAISAGTLEPILKEVFLRNDHFQGHKTRLGEWGKIRGLANTVVGLIILLASIVIDLLIMDWNKIDWPLLFLLTAALQMFAGLMWLITLPLHKRCSW